MPLLITARRGVRIGIALLLAASVALTVAQQARSVGPWWLELSRYLPYPVLLAPGVAALGVSGWLGWRWIAAGLVCLGLAATLGMDLSWGRPDVGELPLRVMTYNIKAYKATLRPDGFDQLTREVAGHAPDLLVVQDNQGPILASEAVAWPDGRPFGFEHVFRAGQYIVASRYPLAGCVLLELDAARTASTAVRCQVVLGEVSLTVVTAHFDSPRDGLNAARHNGLEGAEDWEQNRLDRLWQARLLAGALRTMPRPLLVAGDLNASEPSPVVRTLLGVGLRDAFSSAMRGYGYTYGHALRPGFSFLRIDHILISPELGVADCRVGGSGASEHRPVIADLWLRRRS